MHCILEDGTWIYSQEGLEEYLESLGFSISELAEWLHYDANTYSAEEVEEIMDEHQEQIDNLRSKIECAILDLKRIRRTVNYLLGHNAVSDDVLEVIEGLGN